jgi:hypothetical protein
MVLATAGPTARAVVLEKFDEREFVFWTSSESPKGRAVADDPRAALGQATLLAKLEPDQTIAAARLHVAGQHERGRVVCGDLVAEVPGHGRSGTTDNRMVARSGPGAQYRHQKTLGYAVVDK